MVECRKTVTCSNQVTQRRLILVIFLFSESDFFPYIVPKKFTMLRSSRKSNIIFTAATNTPTFKVTISEKFK